MGSAAAQIPTSFGHELRACLRCRLVKTYDQFRESGCENCSFFKMGEDHERVVDCTTPNFTGQDYFCLSWIRVEAGLLAGRESVRETIIPDRSASPPPLSFRCLTSFITQSSVLYTAKEYMDS